MIGEAPGPEEAKKGEIFTGRAGKKLDEMIKSVVAITYLTNMVKCRPASPTDSQGGFRTPTETEVELCKPLLHQELAAYNATVLMPLGNIALSGLIGFNHNGITKELGKIRSVRINFRDYIVIPNFHPSYICRNPEAESKFMKTLEKLNEYKTS